MPVPYLGSLESADIYVSLLNPGFGLDDYQEIGSPALRRALSNVLSQTGDALFPFLNPDFVWHGGFRWWERKLRPVLEEIAKEKDTSYLDILEMASQRICALELFPYHSAKFRGESLLETLPSTRCMFEFIAKTVVPRVSRGDAILIVTRQRTLLRRNVPSGTAPIIVYSGGQERGAHLGLETEGGKAILQRLRYRT